MDESLYDEFGNFIGDEQDSDAESEIGQEAGGYGEQEEDQEMQEEPEIQGNELMQIDEEPVRNTIVLHEDKQYYPSAEEVFGREVETLVQEEDTQPLSKPIIEPIKIKKFAVEEANLPEVNFSREFMVDMMSFPDQIRNVALVGHLGHGKTAIMDILVSETHDIRQLSGKRLDEQLRYTDTHILERDRGISIKSSPMTLVLETTKGKSHLLNIIDTPGHVNFVDEVACGLRLADGAVLVVDVIEGVRINTEQIIHHCIAEEIPISLVVNKIDRLILDLKMPPGDAYIKIRYCIEQVNKVISEAAPGRTDLRLSPELGNVSFASASYGWCFTLESFAAIYRNTFPSISSKDFAARLWGDIYFNKEERKFIRKGLETGSPRSFVHFVLEPLYKIYAYSVGEDADSLKLILGKLGIRLKPAVFKMDSKPLLKVICEAFFGRATGLIDMIVEHTASPVENAAKKIQTTYTGPMTDGSVVKSLVECNQQGPTVVQVTKIYSSSDASEFYSFGRVLSGTLRQGQEVRVLGENYSLDDEEDMMVATVNDVWIYESRYKIPIDGIPAGNWALIGGIDTVIVKTATILPSKLDEDEDVYIFRPIKHFTESVFKVAVEPFNPSELPKMLEGLRKINKTYPLVQTKVEESGEHIILGTGELYMDCLLHDLRRLYSEMEIKVSDPVTRFSETVVETSSIKCYAETPNKKNKITIIAEPLDEGIAEDIENGKVSIKWPIRQVGKYFQDNYGWDILASRSIWAFGPEDNGPNILQDDTLPSEVDKKLLSSIRESIRQGFQWAVREGPLCEEPIRNCRFKLTDAEISSEPIQRGGGQIIPTVRRACYSSFLMAAPRLMEPVYGCHVIGSSESVSILYTILSRRRGYVIHDAPIGGTPLYSVHGLIPVIDSFGFETDLRVATGGKAMCLLVFEKWQIVPGDPLDKSIKIKPLESSSMPGLARDFVLKTRRRKGLSDEPTVRKYLDESLISSLNESGLLNG